MLPGQAVHAGAAVERLAAARSAPLLLAGCADGRLQLFDLRDARAAAATLLSPSASPLARPPLSRPLPGLSGQALLPASCMKLLLVGGCSRCPGAPLTPWRGCGWAKVGQRAP